MKLSLYVGIALLIIVLSGCESVQQDDRQLGRFVPSDTEPAVETLKEVKQAAIEEKNETANDISEEPPRESECGDGTCNGKENKCTCAKDCGECNELVSNLSRYSCVNEECKITSAPNVCGNKICETGEITTCELDCPNCEDGNACTTEEFNMVLNKCTYKVISPCCGNGKCEENEYNCLIDCGLNATGNMSIDLSKYPEPFVKNRSLNSYIVVGSNASAKLVVATIDIVRTLTFKNATEGYTMKAQMDTNLTTIQNKNVILVGNACHNKFVKQLMNPQGNCLDGLEKGHGLIRLYKTGTDTYAIVIAGYDEENVRTAAQILSAYNTTKLSGIERKI